MVATIWCVLRRGLIFDFLGFEKDGRYGRWGNEIGRLEGQADFGLIALDKLQAKLGSIVAIGI